VVDHAVDNVAGDANLMAQGDSNEIGCVTVNGTVRESNQPVGSTPRRTAWWCMTATLPGRKKARHHSLRLRCLSQLLWIAIAVLVNVIAPSRS
jgi:hypothetical protein